MPRIYLNRRPGYFRNNVMKVRGINTSQYLPCNRLNLWNTFATSLCSIELSSPFRFLHSSCLGFAILIPTVLYGQSQKKRERKKKQFYGPCMLILSLTYMHILTCLKHLAVLIDVHSDLLVKKKSLFWCSQLITSPIWSAISSHGVTNTSMHSTIVVLLLMVYSSQLFPF